MKEFCTINDVNIEVHNHYKKASDKNSNWRLKYHIEPPFGLLNDPNGLCFFNGEYYIFYQWNPNGCYHKTKYWALTKTKDFINYTMPKAVLAPYDWYDKNGCYSGCAVACDNEIKLFYTGNVKDENNNRSSYQCLATVNKNENVIKHGPVISDLPKGYTAHFRDPKVYKHNDNYYMVIGAQNEDLLGRAVVYISDDLDNWEFHGEIKTSYDNFGFMWECPNIFKLDGKDILLFSPQGLESEKFKYQNLYESGYIVGDLDYNTLEFSHNDFTEIDMGADFYAPQIFEDEKGRVIMYGWMGMPEEEEYHPTRKNNFIYSLTLPRELSLKDNKIVQKPLIELEALRQEKVIDINNKEITNLNITDFKENSYELILEFSKKMHLKFLLI